MAKFPYPNVGSEYPDYYTLQVPPTALNNATHALTPPFPWVWAKVTNLRGAASIFVCEDDGGAVHGVEQEILPGVTDYYLASSGATTLYVRENNVAAIEYQVQFRVLAAAVPADAAGAPLPGWGDRDAAALGALYAAGPPPVPGKGA